MVQAVWLWSVIRIDTETNKVVSRFQKGDLWQRAAECDKSHLILAGFAARDGLPSWWGKRVSK